MGKLLVACGLAVLLVLGAVTVSFGARANPSPGWGAAALIETDNAGSAYVPQVAMDPAGNAVAVWHQ